jgi:hypothetical protein
MTSGAERLTFNAKLLSRLVITILQGIATSKIILIHCLLLALLVCIIFRSISPCKELFVRKAPSLALREP